MAEAMHNTSEEKSVEQPTNGEPVVVIDQLVKLFAKLRAVDNLTMRIYGGEDRKSTRLNSSH